MGTKPKILYVDDEVDILSIAESFFEDEDLPLETSSSFNEAMEKIRRTKYDLIISDAHMPNGSGSELFQIIKAERLFEGKFVLVTGNMDFVPKDKSEETFDRVMLKPLNFQDLIDEVKKLLSL